MSIELQTEDRLVYHFYPVTSNSVTFKVKAPNDAHIALTSTPYESNPMYEIFFGGWKNTKSVIRKNQQKPDVVEVTTPNILDENNYKKFWIKWDYGTLSVGVEYDNCALMTWQDSESFPIQYFGVCTGWGAKGHWIIENSPSSVNPPPAFGTNCVSPSNPNVYGYATSGLNSQTNNLTPGFNPQVFGPTLGFNPQVTLPTSGPIPFAPPNVYGVPTTAPKWIPSSNGSVPPNAIAGGVDVSGEQIYVARAPHEGGLIPGKLVPSHRVAYIPWGGRENPKSDYEVQITHGVCYVPFGGQEIAKQQYEILTI